MQINEKTKIAALLKFHPEALETIIKLSPDFKKLRNPLLRKLMAGRTTIAMASKIGGCTPKDFFDALQPLGFEADETITSAEEVEKTPMPEWIANLKKEKIISFDVREMLSQDIDPLKKIQQKINELPTGYALKIINTFEPTPLIVLLSKQGFLSYVDKISTEQIDTYFYKKEQLPISGNTIEKQEYGNWEYWMQKFENNMVFVDVRELEMPMPMMVILENLETLPTDKALFVHHKRIPVFLLTELQERNFEYRILEVSEGDVNLLIFKS